MLCANHSLIKLFINSSCLLEIRDGYVYDVNLIRYTYLISQLGLYTLVFLLRAQKSRVPRIDKQSQSQTPYYRER